CDELLDSHTAATAFMMLDRIQDAYNFGAVIRTAEVFGFHGLIVGASAQAEVNSLAARSSARAANHLRIANSQDLKSTANELRRRGFLVLAAEGRAAGTVDQQDLTGRTVLVLGNEHSGIDEALLRACDASIRIPQYGRTESLNIAVAAGILCYEVC